MQIQDFLGIAIVGVIISFIMEGIKSKYGTQPFVSKGITILLAVILGIGYSLIQATPYYQAVLGALGAASAFWAIFLRQTPPVV